MILEQNAFLHIPNVFVERCKKTLESTFQPLFSYVTCHTIYCLLIPKFILVAIKWTAIPVSSNSRYIMFAAATVSGDVNGQVSFGSSYRFLRALLNSLFHHLNLSYDWYSSPYTAGISSKTFVDFSWK